MLSARFIWLLLLSAVVSYAQIDEFQEERPVAKNAFGIRPQYALFGFYGLSYERYIARNFSVYVYGEFNDGPQILAANIYRLNTNTMRVDNSNIYYTGYGGAIGLRKYFVDKKYTLVGNKDQGSLQGWFVGGHIPVRKQLINMTILSTETHFFARQTDRGRYRFDGFLYGAGVEAGRHWLWGAFSFEVNAGVTYMQGVGTVNDFTFFRPGIGDYVKSKNMGIVGVMSTFAPRLELVLGVAF